MLVIVSLNHITLMQAQEDAETVIQISTPMGKKRRRISSDTGSKFQRLSIIPKLERSFCLSEESFEVICDSLIIVSARQYYMLLHYYYTYIIITRTRKTNNGTCCVFF